MRDIINHTKLGFCLWDIAALLVLLGVIFIFLYKKRQLKKQEESLLKDLEECTPGKTYDKS